MKSPETPLDYIAQNMPVFPCRAADEVDLDTGEIYAAKTPLLTNGLKGATKLPRVVKELWRRTPDAMIGLPTGEPSGVFVLDIDVKASANGYETLAALEAQNGKLPETRAVKTPSGGTHYYFKHVPGIRNRGNLGVALDIRGSGGYVCAAGSRMADGRAYEWVDPNAPIAEAPDWLLELILPPKYEPANANYASHIENTPYIKLAIDNELAELASAPPGNRNNRINDAAFAIGQFVGAGAISRSQAEAELYAIVQQWENVHKSKLTIKSGLEAGIRTPRAIPESTVPVAAPTMAFAQFLASLGGERAQEPIEEPTAPAVVDTTKFHATPFELKDPRELPRREFLYGTHLIRKYTSVTVSPGGVGKTSLTITEAMAMVTGRDLLGTEPVGKLNVWMFNAEDPRDEMERRIGATAIHYKISQADLAGHFFLDTGREQDLIIAQDNKKGIVINVPIVEAVIEQIKKYGVDVMIVDPFVSTHGVPENDNGAIDKVVKTWGRIADATNCAIELVHHVKKVEGREIGVEDSRGAVALISAARSARVLNRMTQDQAAKAGVTEEINSYFSVTRGKASMAALSDNSEWRRMIGVGLGNGRGPKSGQDHVGVATEWKWPTAEMVMESLPDDTLANVCNVLDAGGFRENIQAGDWAGLAVMRVMGMDSESTADKARAKQLLKIWKEEGELVKVEMKDAKGVDRPYLKSAGWVARNRA